MKKAFVLFPILSIFLSACAGPQPTPSPEPLNGSESAVADPLSPAQPEEEWLVHKNEKWGFEFSYPAPEYVIKTDAESSSPDQSHIHLYDQEIYQKMQEMEAFEGSSVIQLSAYANPQGLSAQAWAQKDLTPNDPIPEYEFIQVDGKEGISYVSTVAYGKARSIFVPLDGTIYAFHVLFSEEGEKIVSDFNAIVKTIVFTQPSAIPAS